MQRMKTVQSSHTCVTVALLHDEGGMQLPPVVVERCTGRGAWEGKGRLAERTRIERILLSTLNRVWVTEYSSS